LAVVSCVVDEYDNRHLTILHQMMTEYKGDHLNDVV